MRNRTKNITLKILLISIILLFAIFNNISEASFWSEIFSGGDSFIEDGKRNRVNTISIHGDRVNIVLSNVDDTNVAAIINDIYSIVFPMGVVVTVMVGGMLGIKFMLASAEDKAKIKESMVPYVIGCIVIYGAFGIWKICLLVFSVIS